MEDITQPGALIDERTEEERAKDYRFEELVASAAPVVWEEKKEWRKFPIFDQGQSGSCVAQTAKKQMGVYIAEKTGAFVPVSASHIYQRRSNRPGGGMGGVNVFEILQQGATLAAFAPDEKMSDAAMDKVEVNEFEANVGRAFSIGNYLVVPTQNIDTIASIIQQTGKAVMVWFYFTRKEWTAHPTVIDRNLNLYDSKTLRHSVAAVDFTLKNGKKCLVIDDSWGPDAGNGAGQRLIDEDFYEQRNWFAAHFMNFAFEKPVPAPVPGRPRFTTTYDLEFSVAYKTDPGVVELQDCLKWEGLFPANVDSTGYFGAVTKKSVEQFQTKYSITSPGSAGYGRVGPVTRAKLVQLYP